MVFPYAIFALVYTVLLETDNAVAIGGESGDLLYGMNQIPNEQAQGTVADWTIQFDPAVRTVSLEGILPMINLFQSDTIVIGNETRAVVTIDAARVIKCGKGVSIVPVLKDPSNSVQDSILFTLTMFFFLPENTPGCHIRAIRKGDFLYAAYYSEDGSSFEYEIYNLKNDLGELTNLLYQNKDLEVAREVDRLHDKLKEKMDAESALSSEFPWSKAPAAL